MTPYRKKLIEVDLPLDAISAAACKVRPKQQGHPFDIHYWWARRPLAACRAVLFASMVDDPSALPDEFPTEEAQRLERIRLHAIIERLVVWENSNDEALLADARYEIARSVARSRRELCPALPDDVLAYLRDHAPPVYDPFAGGGSIPLEAQRLGLRAVASDLNPVAVLINKALIELPPKVAGKPPVNPDARSAGAEWRGASGLADDVRYYGKWMRDRAFERIGRLYPKAKLPDGGEATVIAWLWARTIPCPNPACGVPMPMMKSFQVSTKKGNERWARPVVDGKRIRFVVQNHADGVPKDGAVDRHGARCVACGATESLAYVREQSKAGRRGEQMTAIVAEGKRGRIFLSPTEEHERIAFSAEPKWRISQKMPATAHKVSGRGYGITRWNELFTERQQTALATFSDLVDEACAMARTHGANQEYCAIIRTYLALVLSRAASAWSSFGRWQPASNKGAGVFDRQAIPMIWDYPETTPFSTTAGSWVVQLHMVSSVVEKMHSDANASKAYQVEASSSNMPDEGQVIITDPPYYDNISYAELSDFFYVWLRPSLRETYPDLFGGMLVPIDEEMIAAPRFDNARERFEQLLGKSLRLMRERCSDEFPSSIFYAYKQQEEEREGRASTGWEMMLSSVISAGFQIVGAWPMRTELSNRSNAMEANTLASSVVLVCRPREESAPTGTRTQFLQELMRELPAALDHLTHDGHIDPVDLRQAAIGPGMQVYSRYARVERTSGEPVTVREALQEINKAVDFYTERAEGELDALSRFCLAWLRTHGHAKRPFGDAETLAKPMNVSVDGLRDAGLLSAERGEVRLYEIVDYAPGERSSDKPGRVEASAWEVCCRMAYHFHSGAEGRGGMDGAARVALDVGGPALVGAALDGAERLVRMLYDVYDRRSDARAAAACNDLSGAWESVLRRAQELRDRGPGMML